MANNSEFPVPNMPRMGRRNAVAFPNWLGTSESSEGAFSPINLVHRISSDNVISPHPEGVIVKNDNKDQANPPSGISSVVPDGVRKILDATNAHAKFIDELGILDPSEKSRIRGKLALFAAKQKLRQEIGAVEDELFGAQRVTPVIPWKGQEGKQMTLAEERRKMFESFEKTSFEPPETPRESESVLKKLRRKKKKQGKEKTGSQESVASSNKAKGKPDPYSSILPRVNTGMRSTVPLNPSAPSTLTSAPAPPEVKGTTATPSVVPQKGQQNSSVKSVPPTKPSKPASRSLPTQPPSANKATGSKRVNNFPAADAVKNVSAKLPLTIGPRFNLKVFAQNASPLSRAELFSDTTTTRLYAEHNPHQKYKQEIKNGPNSALRGTLQNLQRINTGAGKGGGSGLTGKQASAPINPAEAVGLKKPNPPLTTIQAPPSPFLMSNVSIPNQFSQIPINGEPLTSDSSKKAGKKSKAELGVNKKGGINKAKEFVGKGLNIAALKKLEEPQSKTMKVVPSLGVAANKYNNIYIGPYSGSESDGEGASKTKR